jgi:hypothetical protein
MKKKQAYNFLYFFFFHERLMTNLGESSSSKMSPFSYIAFASPPSSHVGIRNVCIINQKVSWNAIFFLRMFSCLRGVQRILARCCARASEAWEANKWLNFKRLNSLHTQQKSLSTICVCLFEHCCFVISINHDAKIYVWKKEGRKEKRDCKNLSSRQHFCSFCMREKRNTSERNWECCSW